MEGSSKPTRPSPALVQGGIADETEEAQLVALNDWVEERGLPRGELAYDVADAMTGEQQAILDLAWPIGVQEGLSQPVAVLLNESSGTLAVASRAGFRCFTEQRDFKEYLEKEILANDYS
jgi:hypothetical protein